MTDNEWLKNVKVGDQVLIHGYYNMHLKTVSGLTATQVVVDQYRFDRKTGRMRSGPSRTAITIREVTPDTLRKYNLEQGRSRLQMTYNQLQQLDDDLVLKLVEVIDSHISKPAVSE